METSTSSNKAGANVKRKPVTEIGRFNASLKDSFKALTNFSGGFGLLLWFITNLQMFGVVFSNHPAFWNDQFSGWICSITDAILLRQVMRENDGWFYLVWAISYAIIGLLIVVFVLRRFRKRSWTGILLRVINFLFHAATGILYLPFCAMLGYQSSCQTPVYPDRAQALSMCWSSDFYIQQIFAVIIFVTLVVITAVRHLTLTEQVAFDSQYMAKAHGRIEALISVVIGTLLFFSSIMSGYFDSNSSYRNIYVFVAEIAVTTVATVSVAWNPYFYHGVYLTRIAITSILSWFTLAAIVFAEASPTGYESALALYMSTFVVLIAAVVTAQHRRGYVSAQKVGDSYFDYEVEMKCRLLMQSKNDFWNREASNSSKSLDNQSENYRLADSIYKDGLKKFPNSSFLQLAYANFLFGKRNFNYSLTMLNRARSTNKAFDYAFLIDRLSDRIQAVFDKQRGTGEVKNYFRYLNLTKQCNMLQQAVVLDKLELLSEISKPACNYEKLNVIMSNFFYDIRAVQSNYRDMFQINSSSRPLRQYASFVSNIIGHSEVTKAIVARADRLEVIEKTKVLRNDTNVLDTQEALFDESNAVFVLSGSEQNLGEILEVNAGGVELFKYSVAAELIGTNINTLMPSPFAELHHGYLMCFLTSGTSALLNITRTVYAKTKIGFIFEVKLYIRNIIQKSEIRLVGGMYRTKEQPELIVTNHDGQIVAVSENCQHMFRDKAIPGQTSEEFVAGLHQIHMDDWFGDRTNFQDLLKDGQAQAELDAEHRMHIKCQTLSHYGSNSHLFEIWVEDLTVKDSYDNLGPMHASPTNRIRDSPNLSKKHSRSGSQGSSSALVSAPEAFAQSSDFGDPIAVRNAALNVVSSFDSLVRQYRAQLEPGRYKKVRLSLYSFKIYGIGLLIWLLITSFVFNNMLSGLKSSVDELSEEGVRIYEALRIRAHSRNVQIYNGCTPGYTSPLCEILTNTTWTFLPMSTVSGALKISHKHFREANANMMSSLAAKQGSPSTFGPLSQFMNSIVPNKELRSVHKIDIGAAPVIQGMTELSRSAAYIAYSPTMATFQVKNSMPIISPTVGYFNESNIALWRADLMIEQNMRQIEIACLGLNGIYTTLFDSQVKTVKQALIILSIVPVLILVFVAVFFMTPGFLSIVRAHAKSVSCLLNIPRTLVAQWHSSFLRTIESVARDEESMNADIYMFLQDAESNADVTKKKNRVVGDTTLVSKQQKITVDFMTAFTSFKQTLTILRLDLALLIVILIPLASLLMLPTLLRSTEVHAQMLWSNLVMTEMYRIHYIIRDMFFLEYHGDHASSLVYLQQALGEFATYNAAALNLVDGDAALGISGLSLNSKFTKILTGNACSYVSPAVFIDLVLPQTCEQFEQGLLQHGLVQAMSAFTTRSQLMISMYNSGNHDPTAVAAALHAMEALMKQINSVILSVSPLISDEIIALSAINSGVIQPIQLTVAFAVLIYMYFYLYSPLIKLVEQTARSAHMVLMLLWSATGGSGASVMIDFTAEEVEIIAEKTPSTIRKLEPVFASANNILSTAEVGENADLNLATAEVNKKPEMFKSTSLGRASYDSNLLGRQSI